MYISTPVILALILLSAIPIGIMWLEIARRKGKKQATIMVLLFLVFCAAGIASLQMFSFYIVLLFPLFMFPLLLLRRSKKKTNDLPFDKE